MAFRKLRRPDQPLPLRWLLANFEFFASLQLAVFVILASAVVLGWATIIERNYGTDGVRFGVYGTWWFALLNGLLGLNVLCAALIRIPWKKYQTGFVITHTGIILLLVGCLLTRQRGIDAQLPIYEQSAYHVAYEDTQHFRLTVYPQAVSSDEGEGHGGSQTLQVPFASSPFNWRDLDGMFPFPWKLASRDRGLIYNRDGIQLEVLDYYSDATVRPAEPLHLRVKTGGDQWKDVALKVETSASPHMPNRRMYLGNEEELPEARICYWVAGSQAETDAFLDSRPQGDLGPQGLLVLHAMGQRFEIPVTRFQEKSRLPLGETGIQIELVRLDERLEAPLLQVYSPGSPPHRMMLLANLPYLNQQDDEHGVYGVYWRETTKADAAKADAKDEKSARAAARGALPRIDVIQGADRQLYYRVWKSPKVIAVEPLPADGTRVVAGTDPAVTFYVERFTPADRPGAVLVANPYAKRKSMQQKQRQARVRLTVDGRSEEFWLEGLPAVPDPPLPDQEQRKVVAGEGRRVAISMPWDQIELGFQVYLHEFQRKLDPGTTMDSYYASLVDLQEREDQSESPQTLHRDLLISMNKPVDFADPASRRSYRLFQESFFGPLKPGDPEFDRRIRSNSAKQQLFVSWLTVNYDPGRGLKYAGSLLVIAGIITMFYMRAYFFRRGAA